MISHMYNCNGYNQYKIYSIKSSHYDIIILNMLAKSRFIHIVISVLFGMCFVVLPEINYVTPDHDVVEGSGIFLFCNATGNPQPNITWTKQGNKSILSTSKILNLTKLMREDDGSVYTCTVRNEVGSVKASTTITVLCEFSLVST